MTIPGSPSPAQPGTKPQQPGTGYRWLTGYTATAHAPLPRRSVIAIIRTAENPKAALFTQFGISDAAVSQACKRFKARIDSDRKLGKQITAIERKLSKVET